MPKNVTRKRVGRYSDKIRHEAIVEYAVTGSVNSVSRSMDIPKQTVSTWVNSDEGIEMISRVRTENTQLHISQYNRLTEKALNAAERGIDGLAGDKLSAGDVKALTVTAATTTDKSRLLQNLSTSNVSKGTTDQALVDQLAQLSRSLREKNANVIKTIDKDKT